MRILLDANILVRANENATGPSRKLLLGLIARRHVIITSAEILVELGRVLRYPRLQALFRLSEEQIYEYIQFLKIVCEIVSVGTGSPWNVPIRDLKDAHVLRAAIIGEADVICTLDTDFYTAEIAEFCTMLGIAVLDDLALMGRLLR